MKVFTVLAGLLAAALVSASTAAAAPKAYVGLFKDNAVAVVDIASGSVVKTIPIPAGPHGLVATPDGRWVYASSDGDSVVSVIDTGTDTVSTSVTVGTSPHGLAITPDGTTVLVAVFGESRVAFIDTATNAVTATVPVPSPHNIAVSPDGSTAYVAAQGKGALGLAVIDLSGRRLLRTVRLDKTPRALNFSPDGRKLYFTLAGSDSVQVLDPASGQVTAQVPVGASPHHPLFHPDGGLAMVVSQGPGLLYLIDPRSSTASGSVPVGKLPHWIAVGQDGRTALVTNEGSNTVSVVDLASRSVTATIPVGNAPRKIIILPGSGMSSAGAADRSPVQAAISRFAFPDAITAVVGQTIVWTNQDSVPHTVTGDTGAWDSGEVAVGARYTLVLSRPGTYAYHCGIHPFMQGNLVVRPAGS